MEFYTLVIPFFLLLISGILMWTTSYFKEKMWTKLLLIIILNVLCLAAWYSIQSYAGWPTDRVRPMEFVVLQVIIDEPNKQTGDPGYIYLYVRTNDIPKDFILDTLGYKAKDNEPFSMRLPYSRENHKEAQKWKTKLQQGDGKPVVGKIEAESDRTRTGNTYNLTTPVDDVDHDTRSATSKNKPPSRE